MLRIKITVRAPMHTLVGVLDVEGMNTREDYDRWLANLVHAKQYGVGSFKTLTMRSMDRPDVTIFVPENVLKHSIVEFEAIAHEPQD